MSSDFRAYLRRLVRKGRLEVECADGVTETFGDGEGPLLGVKVVDRRAEWRLMVNPALSLGELYMDARLVVTRGDLYSLLDLGARNLAQVRERARFIRVTPAGQRESATHDIVEVKTGA